MSTMLLRPGTDTASPLASRSGYQSSPRAAPQHATPPAGVTVQAAPSSNAGARDAAAAEWEDLRVTWHSRRVVRRLFVSEQVASSLSMLFLRVSATENLMPLPPMPPTAPSPAPSRSPTGPPWRPALEQLSAFSAAAREDSRPGDVVLSGHRFAGSRETSTPDTSLPWREIMRHFSVMLFLVALTVSAIVACGGDDDDLSGTSHAAQCDVTWRMSTPGAVVCPGAADCRCTPPEACCLPSSPTAADVGACSEAASCAGLLFACDGPEDCSSDEVCCGKGQGSQCTTETDCFGIDAYVLCHEDAHCESKVGKTCGPGDPESFWNTRLGVCQ